MSIDLATFERDGFYMKPSLLSLGEVKDLIEILEATNASDSRADAKRGGVRDIMMHVPELSAVASHPSVRLIVDDVLGAPAVVVRSTLFDKTGIANWKVPWHQDVTIAVHERRDAEGYGPWSLKQGITHVQPPTEVLANMLTVRIHLDPCPAMNGALRVIPGSHKLGRIDQNEAPNFVDEQQAITCEAGLGEALVMRPLLLHASSASEQPGHRRVLHFDFANATLANGLQWRLR